MAKIPGSVLFPISVSAGGKLLTQPTISLDNVGDVNYSSKINLRRMKDQEIRREGWVKFQPSTGQPVNQQYIFDGAQSIIGLAEIVRPNGQRVVVGASATEIKVFNPNTFVWSVIGSGFSVLGKRWQWVSINGYLVMNNGVDLPQVFRVEWSAVQPMYEMREVGIACVGRIQQFNGFLFCGDVTLIDSNQLDTFMNGYGAYIPASTITENANFTITAPQWLAGDQFNVTTGASNLVATLPTQSGVPSQPTGGSWAIIKKVDAGAGTVTLNPAPTDQVITLTNQNDTALVFTDGNYYYAIFFPLGAIPATTPYGIVPAALEITNEIPFDLAWSNFGDPTNWAPAYSVYMPAASNVLTLPFASEVLKVGDLVAVVGGGANGGTLGGQSNYPLGVPIIGIAGNQVTLAESTNGAITYPCTVSLLRFADIGSIVGQYQIQADGAQIIGMLALQGILCVYTKTSIFVGRYTGSTTGPFIFTQLYTGANVPIFGDCIISINGVFHLYPGEGGRFYSFDGLTQPIIHQQTDNARDLFFSGISNTTAAWAFDNPLTKEIWFCRPGLVFAFDYELGTVSQIDTEIDAAVFCQKPGSTTDRWVILGIQQVSGASNIYTYALVDGVTPITTWLRDGQPAVPSWASGLLSFGDTNNEKCVISYTPVLSSPSPDMEIEVQLSTTYNPSAPLVAQMNPIATLPDPQGDNFLTTYFQAIYFYEQVTVVDTRDMNFTLSQRLYEFMRIGARGVTRTP